jgi:outer membrane lipoprotein-sorting protein
MALTLLLSLVLTASSPPPGDDAVAALFRRGREVRASLHSVAARFTETTTSSLLEQPLVQTGTLLAAEPGRLLLRYESPSRKVIVVDGDRLRLHSLESGEQQALDTLDIARTQANVRRYLVKDDERELRQEFDIRLDPSPEVEGALRLELTPRRKRIRESLARLTLTLDAERLLVLRLGMEFPSGDRKTIVLEDVQANVPIPAGAFELKAGSKP